MKIKHLSLIAGTIALTLTATSWAVNAETTSSSPFFVAQAQTEQTKGPWQQLGLTDAQKTQLQEIRRNTREEINKILTEEQRTQLRNAMQNQSARRGGRKRMMDSLNLSDEQKTQMREVKRSQWAQMEAILTEEQKAQLKKYREERRARRQQDRQNRQ
ncbi:Spy/CpxP family protein refolding chaperone [Scytonema sp. NUACC26]|uniref:Spy/CpxP family protein refolding chaperone n=1 Tax=Scytonema sp. NUACC26 TaxID=3140176 RepID=UPI0034DBF2A3